MASAPKSARTSKNGGRRQPLSPELPEALTLAELPAHLLIDDGSYLALDFAGLDLSGSEAESAEFEQCRFRTVNLSQSRLRYARILDAELDHCDLANLRARQSSISRAAVAASRMTGLSWVDGVIRDVTFTTCRMDLASFRASEFKDVVFADCKLAQADFGDADLRGARFEACDLSGAQFSGARMAGARMADCVLSGITGVTSLRGTSVQTSDAVALALLLADALGIVIEDGPET